MKKTISFILSIIMALSAFTGLTFTAGAAQTGWVSKRYHDSETNKDYTFWFYYDANGNAVTGWNKIDGKWYYFETDEDAKGLMYSDTVLYDDDANTLYAFSKSGAMLTSSWYQLNDPESGENYWFYLLPSGRAASAWQKINNKWYYFNTESFVMYSGGAAQINGKYYLFENSGAMHTGWVKNESGYWWYFKSSGELARGWQQVKGVWYYFAPLEPNDAESMAIGWRNINGSWYYFNTSGAMKTGWVKVGAYWYYFEASGKMRTANLTYKGKVYRFNSSGACLNP